jgi:hypothetical protein
MNRFESDGAFEFDAGCDDSGNATAGADARHVAYPAAFDSLKLELLG